MILLTHCRTFTSHGVFFMAVLILYLDLSSLKDLNTYSVVTY